MIIVVVAGALALVGIAVAAIALPLWREREDFQAVQIAADLETVVDPLVELEGRRDSVYQAIRELRFDFEVGKVSEADYALFDAQLKGQAVAALKEIDALKAAEADPQLDARLEAEIAALRHVNGSGPKAGKPAQAPQSGEAAATAVNFCPRCGAKASASDRFCGACGKAFD